MQTTEYNNIHKRFNSSKNEEFFKYKSKSYEYSIPFALLLKEKEIALESMDYLDELTDEHDKQQDPKNYLSSIIAVTSRSNESLENDFSEIILNMI